MRHLVHDCHFECSSWHRSVLCRTRSDWQRLIRRTMRPLVRPDSLCDIATLQKTIAPMPRVIFMMRSQVAQEAVVCSMVLDQTIVDNQAKMRLSEIMAKIGYAAVAALFLLTALCRRNGEHGSRLASGREKMGTSSLCHGQWVWCVSVAPPRMRPTYPAIK